jgi:hypothetical protein
MHNSKIGPDSELHPVINDEGVVPESFPTGLTVRGLAQLEGECMRVISMTHHFLRESFSRYSFASDPG